MLAPHVWHGALLGLLATTAVACGGGSLSQPGTGGGDPTSAASAATITTVGPAVVDGCNLQLAFDVVAPAPIGFVGLENLAGVTPTLSLHAVDATGTQTLVNVQATQVDSLLASLLAAQGHATAAAHATNQVATTNAAAANGANATAASGDSGYLVHRTFGDQSLLPSHPQSLLGSTADPLVTSDVGVSAGHGTVQTGVGNDGALANVTGQTALGSDHASGAGAYDANQAANDGYVTDLLDRGLIHADEVKTWGDGTLAANQHGANAFANGTDQASANQTSLDAAFAQAAVTTSAWAFTNLSSLQATHFVLYVTLDASAGDPTLRAFAGAGTALFATGDFQLPMPACTP